jgi:peptidoglycan/LPS O-acetylase OafA/YrhL
VDAKYVALNQKQTATRPRMAITDRRIPELDGLRGIAILLVLIWHFTGMLADPGQGAIQYLAWRFLIIGQSGVDLFFVLSGFLIVGILIDNRESPNYFKTFYVRRMLRILPPYLILVTGFWLCVVTLDGRLTYYFDRQLPLWSLLTFTQNWVMVWLNSPGSMSIGATWSLAIEEQFYLIAPALIFWLPRRWLPKALIAISAASIVARSACFYFYPENFTAPYVGTIFRLDGLCAGGLIAIAYRDKAIWAAIDARRTLLFGVFCALLAIIPLYTWFLRSSFALPALFHFGHTYLALLYGVSLTCILIASGTSVTAWLRAKSLGAIGLISYSLYLFHPSFKGLFFALAHRGESIQTPLDVALLAMALMSTFGFCAALYVCIERPAQKFGKRFRYELSASADQIGNVPVTSLNV